MEFCIKMEFNTNRSFVLDFFLELLVPIVELGYRRQLFSKAAEYFVIKLFLRRLALSMRLYIFSIM